MHSFWSFIDTIKPVVWIPLIFVFHMLLYLALGTNTWLSTSLLATVTYAAAIFILKAIAKRRRSV